MSATSRGRRSGRTTASVVAAIVTTIATLITLGDGQSLAAPHPMGLTFSNPSGVHRTISTTGAIDPDNAFFQELGTNGRSCFTCHRPAQAWTITPEEIRERFTATRGLDPLFRTNDGSNCAGADVSSLRQRRQAFSLLLAKGLIRIELNVPANAEFEVVEVDDPYQCGALFTSVSAYRRPLPTTNLGFISAVMWDGRETTPHNSIHDDLLVQTSSAVTTHAEGAAAGGLTAARNRRLRVGPVHRTDQRTRRRHPEPSRSRVADPGPLSRQEFCLGLNDPLRMLPAKPGACATVSPDWIRSSSRCSIAGWTEGSPERRAIARGESLFNSRTFTIANVPGLNGGPGSGARADRRRHLHDLP